MPTHQPDRYSRQTILPEIGEEGQLRLSQAKAAVVGAGGLGSPVLYYLASAGVGHIKIIDSDTVDVTNLNRQFIHFEDDIGKSKAQSAKEKLERYNSSIQVCAETVRLDEDNACGLLCGCDVVLSCVDNIKTRRLLDGACVKLGAAMIDGGISGFDGYVLTVVPGVTPCWQCVFPKGAREESGGVLGAAAGIIGSMMAMEAVKHVAGVPAGPRFYYVDLLDYRITPITARRDAGCSEQYPSLRTILNTFENKA